MKTEMKELNLGEMEQVNGGVLGLICVLGVIAGGVAIAVGVGGPSKAGISGSLPTGCNRGQPITKPAFAQAGFHCLYHFSVVRSIYSGSVPGCFRVFPGNLRPGRNTGSYVPGSPGHAAA